MLSKKLSNIKTHPVISFFWDKAFIHYFWASVLFSILNIFLLWLFIDIMRIPTVVSSTVIIGGTFLLRFVIFKLLKVVA
jgi:hypothetical protein